MKQAQSHFFESQEYYQSRRTGPVFFDSPDRSPDYHSFPEYPSGPVFFDYDVSGKRIEEELLDDIDVLTQEFDSIMSKLDVWITTKRDIEGITIWPATK